MISCSICLSLSDVSFSIIPSKSIHIANGNISFFFCGWIIFQCVCVCVCVCARARARVGSAWGLIVKMAHYADLINKRWSHSDPWDWPNCPNGTLLSHWRPSSQSCDTTRFQTSGYVTIPSENFSLVGCKKDSVRKGGHWFSLRASRPLFSL